LEEERVRQIAGELMESFHFARLRERRIGSPAACSPKPGEVMVLYWIGAHSGKDGRGPMASEIGECLGVTAPTVTQHLNSLEERGLVERRPDPADRRIVRIRLTDEGRATVERIHEHRRRLFAGLVRHLGEEDSLKLAQLLRKVADYLREETK